MLSRALVGRSCVMQSELVSSSIATEVRTKYHKVTTTTS